MGSTNHAARALSGDRRKFLAAGLATVVAVSTAPHSAAASPAQLQWDAAMAEYSAALAATEADPDDDDAGFAFVDAEARLLNLPAPDNAALRWKLDRVLEAHPETGLKPWAASHLRQTIADYRRLLGDA